jgi:hypothetical protein
VAQRIRVSGEQRDNIDLQRLGRALLQAARERQPAAEDRACDRSSSRDHDHEELTMITTPVNSHTPDQHLRPTILIEPTDGTPPDELITRPPYSDPHHSVSAASIIGGGLPMAPKGPDLALCATLCREMVPDGCESTPSSTTAEPQVDNARWPGGCGRLPLSDG